jgi:all-trans-retinol dehydrogenase (NAD+)
MLHQQKGHIVTMASMASFAPHAGLLDYSCSKIGAMYLSDGIRAECLSRYPGGEAICTTSVHPHWHATNIIGDADWKKLAEVGIKADPPINVSNAVVEQVVKGKSGRLFVPKGLWWVPGIGSLPLWMQDVLQGNLKKRKSKP